MPGAGGRVLVEACGVGARRHRSPRLVEQVEGGLRVGGLRDAVVEDEEDGDVEGGVPVLVVAGAARVVPDAPRAAPDGERLGRDELAGEERLGVRVALDVQ